MNYELLLGVLAIIRFKYFTKTCVTLSAYVFGWEGSFKAHHSMTIWRYP